MKKHTILNIVLALIITWGGSSSVSLAQDVTETIVYVSEQQYNTDLYLLDLHDNTTTRLTFDEIREYAPAWSPDGCLIAYVSFDDIAVFNITDRSSVNLTEQVDTGASFHNYPSWSPDGKYIAYSSNAGDAFGLHILDIDRLTETRLTDSEMTTGTSDWSPDGTYIVFDGRINSSNGEIFSILVDGTGLHNISNHHADDYDPSLSPDGEKIAFSSNRDGNWEIYVMDVDGSDIRRLTFDESVDAEPDWLPDNRQIAFSSNRSGSWEIYVMDVDGSDVQQLTNGPFNQNPRWQPTACKRQ